MLPTTTQREERPLTGQTPEGHVRRASIALYVGAALTGLATAASLVTTGRLGDHLDGVYADTPVDPPSAGAVTAYLVAVGVLGLVGWAVTIRSVRRRSAAAPFIATALVVVGVSVAVAHLTVAEYGRVILPLEVGLASLALCVPGLVAVVELWRRRAA